MYELAQCVLIIWEVKINFSLFSNPQTVIGMTFRLGCIQ